MQLSSSTPLIKVNPLNLGLFVLGALINTASYLSFTPVLLSVLHFGFFYIVLCLPPLRGVFERRIFTRLFLVGFLVAGVAAFYANQLMDPYQLFSDAGGFYEMAATSQLRYLPLIELQVLHEGALAIKLWAVVYDFFSALGFARERYIGVLVNVCAVAMTGVVTLKMTRLVYGLDPFRFNRLMLLFSLCGLFWLFAGIHMRDSIVLLSVTTIAYAWLYFLQKPDLSYRLVLVSGLSVLASVFVGFLRDDFALVPLATAMCAMAALMFGGQSRRKIISFVLAIIGIGVSGWLVIYYGEAIQYTLMRGNEGYTEAAADQNSGNSLGFALIVNQPIPLRLVLGSIYLFLFPIPFWSGFLAGTAHYFFKSANVIYFYFVFPLFVLALRTIWKNKSIRSPEILFLLLFLFGFTIAIAGTSLETRHFGVFLPPMFILALLPDLGVKSVRNNYYKLLGVTLFGVILIHMAWGIMKI